MELKKRGIVRALVVGGALATGWAFNSTDAMAAEVDTEPEVTVENSDALAAEVGTQSEVTAENSDAQEEQSQLEESVEKMEDAVGVVEGDAVAEEGYLEQAQEAIANDDLSNEAADELVSNGQQVLEQAQEKNEVVQNEFGKVEAETAGAKAGFEVYTGGYRDLDEYITRASDAETTEEKIAVLEETEVFKTEYEELLEKYNEALAKYDEIKAKMDALSEALQAEVDARKADKDAIEMELYCLEDELNACKQEISDLESAMQSDEAVAKLAEEAIPSFEESIRENTEKAEDAKKRMEEIQAKLETETDPTVREDLEKQYFEAENDYDEGINNIALFTQGLETNKQKLAKANEDYAEHQKQHEAKSSELEDLNSKHEALFEEYESAAWALYSAEMDNDEEYIWSIYGFAIEDAAWKRNSYKVRLEQKEFSYAFAVAAADYKTALKLEAEAQALVERSETALEKTSKTYDELTKVVEEYKVSQVTKAAQAEESYLDKAKEAIANNNLSNEAADELVNNGKQVLEQAKEKNEAVKNELEKAEAETEEAKAEFEAEAATDELEEYITRVSEAATTEEKIAVLEEAEAFKTEYEELLKKYNEVKAEYDSLSAKTAELRAKVDEDVLKEYEKLLAKEAELQALVDAWYEELDRLSDEIDACGDEVSDLESAIQSDEAVVKLAKEEITQQEEEIKKFTEQAEEASKRMEELQAKLDTETDSSVREQLEKQYSEAENDYDACMNNIALLNQGLKENQNKYDEAAKAQAEHQKQYEAKSRELEELNSKYNAWWDEGPCPEEDLAYVQMDIYDVLDDNALYIYTKYKSKFDDVYQRMREAEVSLQGAEAGKAFAEAAANYKAALEREVEAQALADSSEAALEKASATYDELTKVVEEYKASQVTEPEVTEVTTEKSFTSKISQKVRDIFTGFTVAIEATITTTVTEVAKTVTNAVTQAKETVTTTKVNVAGNAVVKIYDRLGQLVTTLKDAGSFSFGFLGSFFGGLFKF